MAQRVGMVGMGLMGQAFIHNLRKSQFIVQGFDVDTARMDQLAEQGGHPVDTPAAAAKDGPRAPEPCNLLVSPLVGIDDAAGAPSGWGPGRERSPGERDSP